MNLYLYTGNDPVNVIDSNGLKLSLSDLVNYYETLDEAAQKDCKNVIKDAAYQVAVTKLNVKCV